MITPSNEKRFPWQDQQFLAAMLAGLVVWLGLYVIDQPVIQWGWPLLEPWQFLVAVLLYPVLEEIVFRGFIQELFRDAISSRFLGPLSVANLLTSLLFTGLHFITHTPFWAVLVFFPSLLFGLFKDRTGRLLAPILLHVFYNTGYFWLFAGPQ